MPFSECENVAFDSAGNLSITVFAVPEINPTRSTTTICISSFDPPYLDDSPEVPGAESK